MISENPQDISSISFTELPMETDELTSIFAEATEYVLRTMAFVEAKPLPVETRTGNDLRGDVSGIIGLTSGERKLSLAITFSKKAALKVYSSMLGEELGEITSEVGDAVGEITNIICGQARKSTSERGLTFEASIPMVVIGENQRLHTMGATSSVVPFVIDGDMFYVEISVEK